MSTENWPESALVKYIDLVKEHEAHKVTDIRMDVKWGRVQACLVDASLGIKVPQWQALQQRFHKLSTQTFTKFGFTSQNVNLSAFNSTSANAWENKLILLGEEICKITAKKRKQAAADEKKLQCLQAYESMFVQSKDKNSPPLQTIKISPQTVACSGSEADEFESTQADWQHQNEELCCVSSDEQESPERKKRKRRSATQDSGAEDMKYLKFLDEDVEDRRADRKIREMEIRFKERQLELERARFEENLKMEEKRFMMQIEKDRATTEMLLKLAEKLA